MIKIIVAGILLVLGVTASANEEIKRIIEEHYGYINAADYAGASVHHRSDFTMYFPDGGPLWESDYESVANRMKATPNFPESMNLLMSNYDAVTYDDWAIVTFYLSGTHTRNGKAHNVVNRVSAVWIKEEGKWLEAHHHESPLLPNQRIGDSGVDLLSPHAEKIGVFVDVQNIYYTTRDAFGRSFNYRALWQILSLKGDIVVANAYATDRNDESQRKFQSALRHIGFSIRLKPYIQRADGSAKGDWDVGITVDVLQNSPSLDRIFLLSGDGDFDLLVEAVQTKHGVPVEVYGVPALTADSLKRVVSCFHPITESLLIQLISLLKERRFTLVLQYD